MMKNEPCETRDATRLNSLALTALIGLSSTWRNDLVSLLRSDAPISQAVRTEMANVLEGSSSFGVALKMDGHQKSFKRVDGIKARREWFKLGESVKPFVDDFGATTEGFGNASDKIGVDADSARRKYYYWKHCSEWVAKSKGDGEFYSAMSEGYMQDVWHLHAINQKRDNPTPPTGEEYDIEMSRRLSFFGDATRDWNNADSWVSVLMCLADILPENPA